MRLKPCNVPATSGGHARKGGWAGKLGPAGEVRARGRASSACLLGGGGGVPLRAPAPQPGATAQMALRAPAPLRSWAARPHPLVACAASGGGRRRAPLLSAAASCQSRCALLRAPILCSRARSGSRDRLGQETHPYARSRAASVARVEMLRKQSVKIFGLVPAAAARASGRAGPGEPWHNRA